MLLDSLEVLLWLVGSFPSGFMFLVVTTPIGALHPEDVERVRRTWRDTFEHGLPYE